MMGGSGGSCTFEIKIEKLMPIGGIQCMHATGNDGSTRLCVGERELHACLLKSHARLDLLEGSLKIMFSLGVQPNYCYWPAMNA